MTTVGDAIKAAIEDNWNAGTGGTEPPVYNTEDVGQDWPPDDDWVMILGWTFDERERQRNDAFQAVTQYIDLRVHSKNDANGEERLDELVTEIKRIVIPDNVAGYHKVKVINQIRRASDKRTNRYIADLTVELKILSTSSTATPGSTTTSTAEFDELTINTHITGLGLTITDFLDEDNMASDSAAALASQQSIKAYADAILTSPNPINIKPSGNIVDYLEFDTIGGHPVVTVIGGGVLQIRGDSSFRFQPSGDLSDYIEFSTTGNIPKIAAKGASDLQLATDTQTIGVDQIADLLMFGSANAAWVPCIFVGDNVQKFTYSSPHYRNVDATDGAMGFTLPLPTNKGSLKLYVTGLRVVVYAANATNLIDHAYLFANDFDTQTILINDATDRTAQGVYEYALADTDVSGYTDIVVTLTYLVADAFTLRLCAPMVECYYA